MQVLGAESAEVADTAQHVGDVASILGRNGTRRLC